MQSEIYRPISTVRGETLPFAPKNHTPLPTLLKRKLMLYALAGLLATGSGLADTPTVIAQEQTPPTPIEVQTGTENLNIGKQSAIFIGGESRSPSQHRVTELLDTFSQALVERGMNPQYMDLYYVSEDPNFPGNNHAISEQTPYEFLYDQISEKTSTTTGPLLLAMVGHGSTNRYGEFSMIVNDATAIKGSDLAVALAKGINERDHESPINIVITWESCGSSGGIVGGPDQNTPFNDKGQSNVYDQLIRELLRLNPKLKKTEVQNWFNLSHIAPTLPQRVTASDDAFWDFASKQLKSGKTLEEATLAWFESSDNKYGEQPVVAVNDHPPMMGSRWIPESRIYSGAHAGGLAIERSHPLIIDQKTIGIPLKIENYTTTPYSMTVSLINSSGSVVAHDISVPISVSPDAAIPLTATLNLDQLPSDVYTGTLEITDQNGATYHIDFDSRRRDKPSQILIPTENIRPTYGYYDFDPNGFDLTIPADLLPEGEYRAHFFNKEDRLSGKNFTIPNPDGQIVLQSSKPEQFLIIFDEAGNIVHKQYYSVRENNDTFIDAMAQEPLKYNHIYTGTIFRTDRFDKDYYRVPSGASSISIALEPSNNQKNKWFIYLQAHDKNGENLSLFELISSGDSGLYTLPPGTAAIEVMYATGSKGQSPQYSFSLSQNGIQTVFLPLVSR